jgi:Family of unknown function (DUF6163)
MSDALGGPIEPQNVRLPLTYIYMRVVGGLLLLAGLARACQVLGILTPDGLAFADLEPTKRAGAVTLLVVDLFASVGLWIGAAWGPVMWAVAFAIEVAMYTLFSDLFGSYPLRVFVHAVLFAGFLAVTFMEWRRAGGE